MRRAVDGKRSKRAESYGTEPSAEEVAEDRATMRAMRDRNPECQFPPRTMAKGSGLAQGTSFVSENHEPAAFVPNW